MGPHAQRRVEGSPSGLRLGYGQSQPIVWGARIFLTADVEGAPAPADHKAPVHIMEGQPWVHPDSVGIDTLHAMKVLSLDLASGSIL